MFQSAVIHDEYEFTGHNSALGAVCYNPHQDSFVSVDDSCLRLWRASGSRPGGQLRHVSLPARTSRFIQAITYVDTRQMYVASALDGTLRLYDQSLNELAALFTGRGTILSMVFDSKRSRLLTGGVDGCAAWQIKPRPSGVPEGALNPQYEFSPLPKFFHSVTASRSGGSTRRNSKAGAKPPKSPQPSDARSAWVESVQLSSDGLRVYAQSKRWVEVFSAADGARLEHDGDLFSVEYGTLTAFVVQERAKYLVCGTSSGAIVVLARHPLSIVHVFKDHTQSITSLAVHATSRLVISSSLDGSVRLWDLEARRQAHRLDVGQPVHALKLLPAANAPQVAGTTPRASQAEMAGRFYCRLRSSVKLFRIQSIIKEHLPCLAPITILQRVVFPVTQDPSQLQAESDNTPSKAKTASSEQDRDVDEDGSTDEDEDAALAAMGKTRQLIVAAGTDKTLRVFAGRAANEAPSFTWIPDEQALELAGFALHPVSRRLFLLLGSQKLLVVNAAGRGQPRSTEIEAEIETEAEGHLDPDRDGDDEVDTTGDADTELRADAVDAAAVGTSTNCVERVVNLGSSVSMQKLASQSSGGMDSMSNRDGSKTRGNTAPSNSSSVASPAAPAEESSNSATGIGRSTGSGGGALRCICVCPYPPIFHVAPPAAGASSAQAKWFSRSFSAKRHSSSAQQGQKALNGLGAVARGVMDQRSQTRTNADGETDRESERATRRPRRRNALVRSEWEWVVCGSDKGQLLFWHTGLRGGREAALSLEAHDASVVEVSASASSPLLVSLDAAGRANLWTLQPAFALQHVLELGSVPSAFILSPTSELLLSGYDDGRVILRSVGDKVETFVGSGDDHHDATVSSADFLDERGVVLTASVDAVVKVWDQRRVLLRQVTLAMALASLCFLNADGDLLAGLATGTFVISRRDVLPDKLPGPTPRRHKQQSARGSTSGDQFVRPGLTETPELVAINSNASALLAAGDGVQGAGLQSGMSSQVTGTARKTPRSAADQLLTHVIQRPIAAADRLGPPVLRSPGSTSGRMPSRHSHGSSNNSEHQPGKLVPIPVTALAVGDQQEEDWRDEIMPSTPFQKFMRASKHVSSYQRKKSQLPSSPLVLQTLGPSPRSVRGTSGSRGRRGGTPERYDTTESPCSSAANSALMLGVGGTEAPVSYCKHQAPVPPKNKTPRKLWNAIGGEDRRLIVLQRSHLPPC